MSVTMDDGIKRWTAKRKTALVVEIIQGKTTVAEASRAFDLSPSEIEGWVEPPRIYRRVICSTTKLPYRACSGLHRTPPLLLRVGCCLLYTSRCV